MSTGSPQPLRLATGGLIDRSRKVAFTFDGRAYDGYAGDTLASALLANGVKLVGRSFKYHRPRGILSAGPEEPNALVELRSGARREPNSRATQVELFDGLVSSSQNRWPSLRFDMMAVNGLLAPVFKVGFYYKTFMWPASFWEKVYEPLIRRAAGLGRASGQKDPDRYEKADLHCDVLVIGAGPAGLNAALAAARSGARVVLAEQDFEIGGSLLSARAMIADDTPLAWRDRVVAELAASSDVTIMRRTTVFGTQDHGTFGAVERVSDHRPEPEPYEVRQRLWRITAKRSILAAGALERPLVFGDNDRPGIMLAGSVATYVRRFGVLPGREVVVFTTTDEAIPSIEAVRGAGGRVVAVVDARGDASRAIRSAAERAGASLFEGAVITRAEGSARGVAGVEVAERGSRTRTIPCDLVAMSDGWTPTIHLTSHLGHRPRWNPQIAAFVPDALPPGMGIAGAVAGLRSTSEALASGAAAAAEALRQIGMTPAEMALPQAEADAPSASPLWRVPGAKGKAFVDFQNDVTVDDIVLARQEGFSSIELMKRYTTLGMATDQGKTSNVNAVGIMAALSETEASKIGATTFRPPFTPISFGSLAGHARGKHFRPTRRTAGHDWAAEQGAVFVEAGAWLRAQYFPRATGEDWLAAAHREVAAVRAGVGYCDVSTLGKIDLQGADVGVFLDRLYTGTFSTLPIGKVRYGLMLREDGIVLDDGTTARLSENRWLMTTTTVNAAKVLQHMEFCAQVLWPSLDVQFTSVTDQWAQVAVAGPRSRDLLRELVDPQFDISDARFPYMAAGEISVCDGVPARLFRLSFSGELGFEIAVPARFGDGLMRVLASAGAAFGALPYGTEALSIMRVEKGHVAGGELNGQLTARDLGLERMMSSKKDYIGRMLAQRPAFLEADRPRLIGVRPVEHGRQMTAGAHFLDVGAAAVSENDLGYVTSVANSPTLGHIGLGVLKRGPERIGEQVIAYDPLRGLETRVEVCNPVFYDPTGARLRG